MWQYQTFSFLLILGTASSQCAYPPPAASILWEGVLIYGKTWYAQQRFGHPTGFITDKCFLATAGLSDVKPDISIHFPVTYFDERNNQQESTVVSYIVGLKSKFYIHHNNTDFLVSDYVITTSYIVSEICDMNTGRCEYILTFL
nr:unnamed protein product [Callosobruchus chinensis]